MRLTFSEVRLCIGDIPEYDRAFRFYAAIMDVQAECKRLWAYLRWLDKAGSGCAVIQVSIAAKFLQCSKQTIYRMLALGLTPTPTVPRKGDNRPDVPVAPLVWFRSRVSCGGGVIRVWYSSAVRVCEGLGLYSPGAISDATIDALSRPGAKFVATELTAIHRQRQAHHAARTAKANKHVKVLEPWLQSASEISTGVHGVVVKKGTLVPAISLKGVAKVSNWSVHTIRRRLNNKFRLERGFDPIVKCPTFTRNEQLDRYLRANKEFFKVFAEDGVAYRLINNLAFQIGPNIYKEDYRLLSCRRLRARCWAEFKYPIDVARAIRVNTQNMLRVAGASGAASLG